MNQQALGTLLKIGLFISRAITFLCVGIFIGGFAFIWADVFFGLVAGVVAFFIVGIIAGLIANALVAAFAGWLFGTNGKVTHL